MAKPKAQIPLQPPPRGDQDLTSAANPTYDCFDQGMRYLIKCDPDGICSWTSSQGTGPRMRFIAWDDTRAPTKPGEPERTADTIAQCEALNANSDKYRVKYESQTRYEADLIIRFLGYQGIYISTSLQSGVRLYHYLCAFLLTGENLPEFFKSTPPDCEYGSTIRIQAIIIKQLDANQILAEIEQGLAPKVFLPLIPLMENSGHPTIIQNWKSLVARVSNRRLASDFVVLTKMFSNKSHDKAAWHAALGLGGLERDRFSFP